MTPEGLVEWLPRRALYVRRFNPREVAQLFQIREALEPIAARLAATRIDRREVEELPKMFEEFTEHPTPAALRQYLRVDRHFHRRLVELTANPFLAAARQSVNIMISAYQVGVPRSLAASLPEHRAILEALRQHEPEASERAMRIHIQRSREKLVRDADAAEQTTRSGDRA